MSSKAETRSMKDTASITSKHASFVIKLILDCANDLPIDWEALTYATMDLDDKSFRTSTQIGPEPRYREECEFVVNKLQGKKLKIRIILASKKERIAALKLELPSLGAEKVKVTAPLVLTAKHPPPGNPTVTYFAWIAERLDGKPEGEKDGASGKWHFPKPFAGDKDKSGKVTVKPIADDARSIQSEATYRGNGKVKSMESSNPISMRAPTDTSSIAPSESNTDTASLTHKRTGSDMTRNLSGGPGESATLAAAVANVINSRGQGAHAAPVPSDRIVKPKILKVDPPVVSWRGGCVLDIHGQALGTSFEDVLHAHIGNVDCVQRLTFISDQLLRVVLPRFNLATKDKRISLEFRSGGAVQSDALTVDFLDARTSDIDDKQIAPEVSGLSPKYGPCTGGTEIKLYGKNFGNSWDDIKHLFICGIDHKDEIEKVTDHMIKCITRPGMGSGTIVVVLSNGAVGTSFVTYTYNQAKLRSEEQGPILEGASRNKLEAELASLRSQVALLTEENHALRDYVDHLLAEILMRDATPDILDKGSPLPRRSAGSVSAGNGSNGRDMRGPSQSDSRLAKMRK
eukprot:m.143872 g.143872  ORF g.143872 m.143872 type:complete len:572 (+) comp16751_c0_seq1:617-2332(+)